MQPITVIVPLLNESLSLERLWRELREVAQFENWDLKVIFVDDGSTDSSWETITRLAQVENGVSGIRLARHYGKSEALHVGFRKAATSIVAMIDADLQDVPAELPKLLRKLQDGFDLVTGWKQSRCDSMAKRLASRLFNRLVNLFSGLSLHDHNCGMKVMLREVALAVPLANDSHRFLTVAAKRAGYRVAEVAVEHRPREFGRSKYDWKRLPKGFVDLVRVFLLGNLPNKHLSNQTSRIEVSASIDSAGRRCKS